MRAGTNEGKGLISPGLYITYTSSSVDERNVIKLVLIPSLRTDVRVNWQSWNSDGMKIAKGSGWKLSHICVTGAWSRPQHLQRLLYFFFLPILINPVSFVSRAFSLKVNVQKFKRPVLSSEGQLG